MSYNLEVLLGPNVLLYQGTLGSSSPIIYRYSQILIFYYMKVPLGPHVLLYEGTLGVSCHIIWKQSWVLMSYYLEVPLGPHLLSYEGTHGSSCPIIWRYPGILISYYMKVPLGPDFLLNSCFPLQNKNSMDFYSVFIALSFDMSSYCHECFFMLLLRFNWHTSTKWYLN